MMGNFEVVTGNASDRRELGSVEYLVPEDQQPVFSDEDADREVKVTKSDGWHVHHEAQHVFSNANSTKTTPVGRCS